MFMRRNYMKLVGILLLLLFATIVLLPDKASVKLPQSGPSLKAASIKVAEEPQSPTVSATLKVVGTFVQMVSQRNLSKMDCQPGRSRLLKEL